VTHSKGLQEELKGQQYEKPAAKKRGKREKTGKKTLNRERELEKRSWGGRITERANLETSIQE